MLQGVGDKDSVIRAEAEEFNREDRQVFASYLCSVLAYVQQHLSGHSRRAVGQCKPFKPGI